MVISDIISFSKDQIDNYLNVYLYGSRVYQTHNNMSDYDYIIVVKNKTRNEFSNNKLNIHYYTIDEFSIMLIKHDIRVLECIFSPPEAKLLERYKFSFKLNLNSLRHCLSEKASNSFVKAKKKLIIEKDYNLYIGQKSLFHSLRIIRFGIQIAHHGKIINYAECNDIYNELIYAYDWDTIFTKYKPIYNSYMSEFRSVAPKDI